jgi:two-component system, NarL family, invasion response regulator UvrY
LTNIAKHSIATQAILILKIEDQSTITLTIEDNGKLESFPLAKNQGVGFWVFANGQMDWGAARPALERVWRADCSGNPAKTNKRRKTYMIADKITILLVDNHAIVREGYRALVKQQPDLEVVAEAVDGNQAYQQYKLHSPDVTIMDLSLPGQSGVETIAYIKQRNPREKILVFTMHQNPRFAVQAIKAGALGYVTKSSLPEVLLTANYDVHSGRRTLSLDIAWALPLEKTGHETTAMKTLTTREYEILRLLAEGKSKDGIA